MSSSQAITFLMPVKDGEKYLSRSIKSLTSNYLDGDEIVVVNDYSTDNTLEMLRRWDKGRLNVKIVNSKSAGLVNALNFGISESSNDWIARFDVDDVYPKNRISEIRKSLSGQISCVFTDYKVVTSGGRRLGTIPTAIWPEHTYLSLVSSQRTAHPSVCFNRSAALSVGGYTEDDFPAEDLSLWLKLSKVGEIISIPKILLDYYVNNNSVSSLYRNKAIAKKHELISKFRFNLEILESCIERISSTEKSYLAQNHSAERYVLHLRDLILISKYLKFKDKGGNYKIQKHIFSSIPNYSALANLTLHKLSRQLYRLS